jgi:hypothetical protein
MPAFLTHLACMAPMPRIGLYFGMHPLSTIAVSLLVVAVLSCGMFLFEQRDDQDVWLPKESELLRKKLWLSVNFPAKMYEETVLIVGDNVLTPEVLGFVSAAGARFCRL